jgi:argininosuccinate lyase
MSGNNNSNLWGGRFKEAPSAEMVNLSRSVQFDWRLAPYDLRQSAAHAKVLHAANLLTEEELGLMLDGITQLFDQVSNQVFQPAIEDEDVHSALERGLIELLGPELGGKLRAGRSRNDQVATDFRMYIREQSFLIEKLVSELALAFLEQAEQHVETAAPGFTHLQHAQPVSFGHELAKHCHSLIRDIERIKDWRDRHNYSPMGAGALAGSSLPLDPQAVARELDFIAALPNSIDAVSARDFVSEFLFITAQIGINLSRIGEEVVLWNSREFGWVNLHDSYSTGSSIMPQKKNPDIAELSRGKAGRLIGDLTGFLATAKSLPFGYNRDLQEDKEPVFDSVDTLLVLIPAVTGMIQTMTFNTDVMEASAPTGFALATDIAEWLVRTGTPFRVAHELAGACVAFAETKEVELWQLSADEFLNISPLLTAGVQEVLTTKGSMNSRSAFGGTAPVRVREQLQTLRSRLGIAQ